MEHEEDEEDEEKVEDVLAAAAGRSRSRRWRSSRAEGRADTLSDRASILLNQNYFALPLTAPFFFVQPGARVTALDCSHTSSRTP